MSTNLGHGYRLTGVGDFLNFATSAREALRVAGVRARASWLVERAVLEVVSADVSGLPRPVWPLGIVASSFDEEQLAMKRAGRIDQYDYEPFSVSVQVMPCPLTGDTLALLFTRVGDLVEAWRALPGVAPYPYWNSSDAPDGVSAGEWELRRRAWDSALGTGVPADNGVSIRIRQVTMRESLADLVADDVATLASAAPDMRTVVARVARRLVCDRLASTRLDGSSEPDDAWLLLGLVAECRPVEVEEYLRAGLPEDVLPYALRLSPSKPPAASSVGTAGFREGLDALLDEYARLLPTC